MPGHGRGHRSGLQYSPDPQRSGPQAMPGLTLPTPSTDKVVVTAYFQSADSA